MEAASDNSPNKNAHSIPEICEDSGLGRTFIYEEIKAGRLIARKAGRRTLVIDPDYKAWLNSLPKISAEAS